MSFPIICAGSFAGSVAVTLLTRPVEGETLVGFYRTVRPFGAWGPVRREASLSPQAQRDPAESAPRALLNVALAMAAVTGLYLAPMYLIGHWYIRAGVWLAAALVAIGILAVTWYRYLPAPGRDAAG